MHAIFVFCQKNFFKTKKIGEIFVFFYQENYDEIFCAQGSAAAPQIP